MTKTTSFTGADLLALAGKPRSKDYAAAKAEAARRVANGSTSKPTLTAHAIFTGAQKKSTPAKAKAEPKKADPIKKLAAEYATARVPEKGSAAWWTAYKTYTAAARAEIARAAAEDAA